MIYLRTLSLIIGLCCLDCLNAQDQIMMLNGDVLEGKITEDNPDFAYIKYNFTTRSNKIKSGMVEYYRVFSVINADGDEKVYYEEDSLIGNVFSETEMRSFIIGERDAKIGYKPALTLWGGLALGVGTVIFDTYTFKADVSEDRPAGIFRSEPSMLPLIVPLAYTIISGIPKVKVKLGTVSNPQFLNDDYYMIGYSKKARSKKVFNAFKGSIAGVALGLVSYFALRP